MGSKFSRPRRDARDELNSDDLPRSDTALLFTSVADGVPPYIGAVPDIQLEAAASMSTGTREGFALLCTVFEDESPEALRAIVEQQRQPNSQPEGSSRLGQLLEQAVQDFAANASHRAKYADRYSTAAQLDEPPSTAVQYLRRLAAAAAADADFVVPQPAETARVLNDEDEVSHSGSSSGGGSDSSFTDVLSAARREADCEVCGDFQKTAKMCACGNGHRVCSLCLRQYCLWTHGLNTGLKALSCLAFHEEPLDGLLQGDRCSGGYSLADLRKCLRPTELLALQMADATWQARIDRGSSIPFGCLHCNHAGSMTVAQVQSSLQQTVQERKVGACGLRRRWVNVGSAPLQCPSPSCNARYCARCGQPEHADVVCSSDPQDAKLMDWVRNKQKRNIVQRCPRCRLVVEKNGGCRYMLCPMAMGGCGYEFCWMCREEYVGMHRCGRPAQNVP